MAMKRDAKGRFVKQRFGGWKRTASWRPSGKGFKSFLRKRKGDARGDGFTIDIDMGFMRAKKLIEESKKLSVGVGWHKDVPDMKGMTFASLGAIHEYGTKDGHIPARPTLGPVFNTNQRKYRKLIRTLWHKVLGSKGDAEKAVKAGLLTFGQVVVNDMKRYMNAGTNYIKLKPATIARKGSTKPLIDTGALRNHIEAKIVKPGEDE